MTSKLPQLLIYRLLMVNSLFFTISSCGQNFNMNTSDKELYGNSEVISTNPRGKAYTVLKNNCLVCHSGWGISKEEDIDNLPYIIPNDFTATARMLRLNGVSTGGDMPNGNPPLTLSDVALLQEWVNSL